MKLRKASLKWISDKSAERVINDLRSGNYSLLATLSSAELRHEMSKVGTSCRTILNLAERLARTKAGGYQQNLRKSMLTILNWMAPVNVHNVLPHQNTGIVLGFIHPTLGEIIRMIAVCLKEYPNRRYLFPVNLPWYEELAPIARRMEMFGLYIVPVITPATRERILKNLRDEQIDIMERLTHEFNQNYLATCSEFIFNGDVVAVAPSATRQYTVFKSRAEQEGREKVDPQTMTLIAINLERNKELDCVFVPIAVVPPIGGNRELNLFTPYSFYPCGLIFPSTVTKLCHNKNKQTGERKFERYFLEQIADELADHHADYLIYP